MSYNFLKPKRVTNLPKRQNLTVRELQEVRQEGRDLVAAVEAHTASLDQLSGEDFCIRLR